MVNKTRKLAGLTLGTALAFGVVVGGVSAHDAMQTPVSYQYQPSATEQTINAAADAEDLSWEHPKREVIRVEDGSYVYPSFYTDSVGVGEVEYDLTLIEGEDLYYELNDPKALMELYRFWYGDNSAEFGDDLIGNP